MMRPRSPLCDRKALKSVEALPTPEKLSELPRRAGKLKSSAVGDTVKIPADFEMLAEFFNCLDSSIRLLRLKGAFSTLTNISASIQHLAERRFTCRHLAQMKHIFPEAISIKKMLYRDEATSCMKPELKICLLEDAVESCSKLKDGSASSTLRKVFRERLVQFFREHPEENDIPEETLPYPFGHKKSSRQTKSNEFPCPLPTESSYAPHSAEQLARASHLPASFQRRFSKRNPMSTDAKTPLAFRNDFNFCSDSPVHEESLVSSLGKRPLVVDHETIEDDSVMVISSHGGKSREASSLESTPVKDTSISACLMTTTPDLQTSKRSSKFMVEDVPQKELMKRATRTKLFSTPRKNAKSDDADDLFENSPTENILDFLPESLLQDIRDKEKLAKRERDADVAAARLRKKMITSLPKLFDSILFLLQSGNRSVITKQELVHKIISNHYSLIDRNEVEEQLKLMEELVPDWISRKATITGDILYWVNKMSSSQDIRQRLVHAK